MRRADRLFQIVQILRNRRSVTAKYLAERLAVSERTIYRDMQDISLSGVPIEGEAGIGYMLRHSIDMPPLLFSEEELQALVLGARMVESWGSESLAQAAKGAIDKIEGALPASMQHITDRNRLYAFPYDFKSAPPDNFDTLRKAINEKYCLEFDYKREDGQTSHRIINPLAMYFWGSVWTLTGWCQLRNTFRNFRPDRIYNLEVLDQHYIDQAGQTLEDYIELVKKECEEEKREQKNAAQRPH